MSSSPPSSVISSPSALIRLPTVPPSPKVVTSTSMIVVPSIASVAVSPAQRRNINTIDGFGVPSYRPQDPDAPHATG